jgi:Tfp pilus assembly protein FimT
MKVKIENGFSIIEMMVVIGILMMIFSFGLAVNLNFYKGYIFRSEQSILVSTLERAQSHAMSNLYATSWGVCYHAPNYVVFRGTQCDPALPTNELIPANQNIAGISNFSSLTSFPVIVWSQLAGTTTTNAAPTTNTTIILKDGAKTATTTINFEGRIDW